VEDFRKTRFAKRTQADAPEAVFGHSKKFNPLLPACKRTAHPDQEQQIQSRQGQSRKVMAAGAPGQEDVNQPERFSGLQRTVEAWQLSGPGVAPPGGARPATGCVMGSVPPFSFNPQVRLVVDPALVERFGEIAFNAGRLDRSIVLDSADYVRIARPALHSLSGEGAD